MDASITNVLRDRNFVLVSEDLASLPQLERIFRDVGAQARSCGGNYTQAIDAACSSPVDAFVIKTNSPFREALGFVKEIRSKTESPLIFFVADRQSSKFDEAFFRGVDGVFLKSTMQTELAFGMASMFAEVTSHLRKSPRVRVSQLTVRYAADKREDFGFAVNVGTGGMFIGSTNWIPDGGQRVNFHVSGIKGYGQEIEGTAIVRWRRSGLDFGRPPGFGIEYFDISGEARDVLLRHAVPTAA